MAIELFFVFIAGLIIGSFLNCLIWRLHINKPITGRSICPKCKKKINWYDNIPVFSFLVLKGKCRWCKKKISWQYPVVEIITGILFLLVWNKYNATLGSAALFTVHCSLFTVLRNWIFIAVLIVIFVYDLRWYLILDKVTLPAMAIAFIINLVLGFSWLNLLLAALIAGGFFALQFIVSKGKWIGGGDIRLGALMGFMLGWPQIITALMLAYLSGSLVGILLLISKKKKWTSQIPFGTFLSAATVAALLWGEEILGWYLLLIK